MSPPTGGTPDGDKPSNEVTDIVTAEVAQIVREERPIINIDKLLVLVAQKAGSSDEALANAEKTLAIARQYEDHHLDVFKRRATAIIDAKLRDPDEIEKRKNNSVRRCLKWMLGCAGVVGLAGMLASAALGGTIVVTGFSGAIGAMCLALLGPLASGESVSSNDVINIINALRKVAASQAEEDSEKNGPGSHNAHGGKRRRRR